MTNQEEVDIEAAYWRFDARRKGYSQWRETPMSERDAFKAEMRLAINLAREECAEICERLSIDLDRQRNTADACKQAIMETIKNG